MHSSGLSLTNVDMLPKIAEGFNVEIRANLFILTLGISAVCTVTLLLDKQSVRVITLG
jgi:hypothetical protein